VPERWRLSRVKSNSGTACLSPPHVPRSAYQLLTHPIVCCLVSGCKPGLGEQYYSHRNHQSHEQVCFLKPDLAPLTKIFDVTVCESLPPCAPGKLTFRVPVCRIPSIFGQYGFNFSLLWTTWTANATMWWVPHKLLL
jgi:hypothetical protein